MKIYPILLLLATVFGALGLQAQTEENAFFIQIASFKNPNYADFKKIHQLGYLFEQAAPNGQSRVMLGTFASSNTANQKLAQVKAQGYKDAFIQKVAIEDKDAVYIIQLATLDLDDEINWKDWQSLAGNQLVAQPAEQKVRLAVGSFKTEEEAEEVYKKLQNRAPKDMFIKRVSSKALHKVTSFEMSRSKSYQANPSNQISRVSVQKLKAFLSEEGFYKQKIDGIWDKNGENALVQYQQNNQSAQNYQLVAEKMRLGKQVEDYSLQYYINLIGSKPYTADEGLKQFKHPLAKAYRAYMYLNGDIQIADYQNVVDKLMREACEQIFGGYKQKTRSDFGFSYSYKEVGQLIQHLRELHEASKDEPDFPCWLFQRHPETCERVFAPYWNNERDFYNISSDCGSFFAEPALRQLMAVGADFEEKGLDKINWNELNRLYAQPKPLNAEEMQAVSGWNANLWSKLQNWASSNQSSLQQRLYKSLQYSYFNSLRLLEEHFMKQNFSLNESNGLGLKVLWLSVGQCLTEFK